MSTPVVIHLPLNLLPRKAQPRPYDQLIYEQVGELRHLGCAAYGGCLNFAVHANWTGFHCLRCPRFEEATRLTSEAEGAAKKCAPAAGV